jgi:gliding motility-associated-like protein
LKWNSLYSYPIVLYLLCSLSFPLNVYSQQCNDTSYNFILTTGKKFFIHDQLADSAGNNLYCGSILTVTGTSGLLLSNNSRGDVQWARSFATNNMPVTQFEKITRLADNGILATGKTISATGDTEYLVIARFNASGTLVWYHYYKPSPWTFNTLDVWPRKVIEDAEGNLYFSFYSNSFNFYAIAKLDGAGSLIWSRSFRHGGGLLDAFYSTAFVPAIINKDTVAFIGAGYTDFFNLKINKNTGDLFSVKRFPLGSPISSGNLEKQSGHYFFPLSNSHYITVFRVINAFPAEYSFVEWDENLKPVNSYVLKLSAAVPLAVVFSIMVKGDGTIFIATPSVGNSNFSSFSKFYLAMFDGNTHEPVMQKKVILNRNDYNYTSLGNSIVGLNTDGQARLTPFFGNNGNYGMDCYYFDPQNTFSSQCIIEQDTSVASLASMSMQEISFSFDNTAANVLEEVPIISQVSDEAFTKQEVCKKISVCDQLKIKGEQNICLYNSPAEFIGSKGEGCLRKVNWHIDKTGIDSLKTINDSTVHIYFGKEWKGKLYASLQGCTLTDSISIEIKRNISKPDLINDATICNGETLPVMAPQGYLGYTWSTGNTGNSTTINHPGQYSLLAERTDGCFDADTMMISTYPSIPIELAGSRNHILCTGQNDTLTPGPGYASYLWQDGSNNEKMAVSRPGTYWIKVKDQYGCLLSDTAIISDIVSPPANIIDDNSTICQHGSVMLYPKNVFVSYLWSTGATSATIQINRPGSYSLTVKDSNDCVAKQDILVQEINCPNKIYFPTAFSPNGDGRNDGFNPYVTGNIASFHLQVFDRWGQQVFESRNPNRGWTGKLQSTSQPVGVYVWQSTYQFVGEPKRILKGTVMLIR